MAYQPHLTKGTHGTATGVVQDARLKIDLTPDAIGRRYIIYCDVLLLGLPSRQPGGTVLSNVRCHAPITIQRTVGDVSEIGTASAFYDSLYTRFGTHPFNLPQEEITELIVQQITGRQVTAQNLGGRWTVT